MNVVLRYCLLGYGISGIAGLAVATWIHTVLGVLIFWLGGGALSVGWIYWVYRRRHTPGPARSGALAAAMGEGLESRG